ncbi:MAG: putative flavoprotein YqcA (clustered with tRNA pseudouridine synthase C) [Enhydrobacter sp.]|jgi:MioC protein|nr:MAG: putative flavoprotein YqcA (clustered with tRNA pseudouridine synthase C) [Enhydrobacter sp.]
MRTGPRQPVASQSDTRSRIPDKMSSILILVGTESGNAQMVADALKPVLETSGHAVDVSDQAASAADLQAHDVLLVVCATHGSGDIPTNILPLAETLERERPDLSGHRYGVIALGDMTYQDTFCGGGKKVDQVLERCGATKIGDRLEVDASSQPLPDEEALAWVEGWKGLV